MGMNMTKTSLLENIKWQCRDCGDCGDWFGSDDPQHRVYYVEDEAGNITPHDAMGISERVRELLRDLKRGVPSVKATVGPEYFCGPCYRRHFPNARL